MPSDAGESDLFGKYRGGGTFISPVVIDAKSALNPYSLTVVAAGNTGDEGPKAAVSYTDTFGNPVATPRAWVNGDAGGYDTLNPLAVAKNALVVGALKYTDDGATASSVVESYSAAGPTDDGRIKPDLVAIGTVPAVAETRNPSTTGPDALDVFNSYQTFSANTTTALGTKQTKFGRTSAAAPSVTAAFALAMERRAFIRPKWVDSTPGSPTNNGSYAFNYPRASALRAGAIATATDIGSAGPDFKTGYGAFNARAYTELVSLDASDGLTYNTDPVYAGQTTRGTRRNFKNIELPRTVQPVAAGQMQQAGLFIEYTVQAESGSLPVKITASWTDAAGTADSTSTADATAKRLKNDIDLRVYPPGNTSNNPADAGALKPYILNPDLAGESAVTRAGAATTGDDQINNVEQVVIPANSAAGSYRVRVTYKPNVASSQVQWVSLAMTNVAVKPWQNSLDVTELVLSGGVYSYNLVISGHAGGVYQIEESPNLTSWTTITGDMSLRTDTASWARTSNTGRLYFRLKRKD